jgi:hypothetical protein
MNYYKKLQKNPFINKQLCIKYIKSKFQTEIDNTIGNKGYSFNSFLSSEEQKQKKWVINMKTFYENEKYKNMSLDDKQRRIFALYYGSVNIFKPSIAKWLCDKYLMRGFTGGASPIVLDPFAGWASRMLGCVASGCKYIGIDSNVSLREGYDEIITELELKNIEIIFEDCMNIDYSKYDYDMVLTSPPYYNLELYTGTEKRSKKDWNEFYKEIFTKVFNGLKIGGYFCINVNTEIYERNLLSLLGEPLEKVEYPKTSYRRTQKHNSEYIYIWIKH